MNWTIHATIVSCTLALSLVILLTFATLKKETESCADHYDLAMQGYALKDGLAKLEASNTRIEQSLEEIRKQNADEAIRSLLRR